jgi:hypothetical protein
MPSAEVGKTASRLVEEEFEEGGREGKRAKERLISVGIATETGAGSSLVRFRYWFQLSFVFNIDFDCG